MAHLRSPCLRFADSSIHVAGYGNPVCWTVCEIWELKWRVKPSSFSFSSRRESSQAVTHNCGMATAVGVIKEKNVAR